MSSYTRSSLSASSEGKTSWKPKTPAGRIVKRGEVSTLKELRRLKLDVKEPEIIDHLYPDLQEEVLKISNIGQGQYRRKAFVIVGDGKGLLGLGRKCAGNNKEAIAGAKRNARLSLFQIEVPSNKTLPRIVTASLHP